MIPKRFEYLSPSSLLEVIELLKAREDSKILAGGQSLLALMKLRLASPKTLIDITKLKGLSYIREEDGYLAVGALTVHDALQQSKVVTQRFEIVSDAARRIGDQQTRNLGTIGGSVCHADPAADLPVALLALDATFVTEGERGRRTIAAKDMFLDSYTTALEKTEVLTEIRIPILPSRSGSAYIKHTRRAVGVAIVGVGAVVTLAEDGKCVDAKIGLGAVAPTPIRAPLAEEHLRNRVPDDEVIASAADLAQIAANPAPDMHGSREYRLDMIRVFTERAVKRALERVVG